MVFLKSSYTLKIEKTISEKKNMEYALRLLFKRKVTKDRKFDEIFSLRFFFARRSSSKPVRTLEIVSGQSLIRNFSITADTSWRAGFDRWGQAARHIKPVIAIIRHLQDREVVYFRSPRSRTLQIFVR